MEKTKIFVELYTRFKQLNPGLREAIEVLIDDINEPTLSADERFESLATISNALGCE